MSENLRAYTKSLYAVDGVVRRLREFDWDSQSPNSDWTARQTLGHVIWGVRRMANAARGEESPAAQAEADVAGEAPIETWSEAMDNVLEALDHHGVLDKVIETPFGSMTVDDALGSFFTDPLTHAWDIARSAGIDAALPPELAQRGIAMLAAAGDILRGPGRLDDPIDVDESSPVVDKFIALTGRDPR